MTGVLFRPETAARCTVVQVCVTVKEHQHARDARSHAIGTTRPRCVGDARARVYVDEVTPTCAS